MRYKAVFIDMDGTLLNENDQVPERTVSYLQRLDTEGVKVHLATGRHYDIVKPYYEQLGLQTPVICLNGSYIYDPMDEKEIYSKTFSVEVDKFHTRMSDNIRTCENIILHTREGLYCQTIDEVVERWISAGGVQPYYEGPLNHLKKMDILKYGISAKKRYLTRPWAKRGYDLDVIEWDDGFEVVSKGVSKWSAIQVLLEKYQMTSEEVITIGDGPNDVDMIRGAGLGIAMRNAVSEVLSASDMTTIYSHNQEGVMDTLSLVLKEQTV